MTSNRDKKKKILFLVTEDWYFCSHRIDLARAAKRRGLDVVIATRVQKHGGKIISEGFKLIPINMLRSSRNPLKELLSIIELARIYKTEKPDIVHHVAIKPVLYGGFAAYCAGVPAVVNALAGMGYVFTSDKWKSKILRSALRYVFRFLLNRSHARTIVQNPEDQKLLVDWGKIKPQLIRLVRGSGVDLKVFSPVPEPAGLPNVVLASRMLWDKGIGEFIKAASILKSRGLQACFILVGDGDEDNPAVVPDSQLQSWNESGTVAWLGRRDDMPNVIANSHIFCLPSYREGLPKVLLEAASCGRPIVTTDVSGCREIVRDRVNGLLVPVKDPVALANALQYLIENKAARKEMGGKGREIVEAEFSVEKVAEETLAVYQELLG